ncbi:MAG TPA: sigma 54-interacting transcriptional regulator [Bryobacteraceae bacterium]|nr:sigma 54-interacting transcriptional regulator [Bryobacteraceae bacterium]
MEKRVLLIDNDLDYGRLITTVLSAPPGSCQVNVARTLADGLASLRQFPPHAILVELNLADSTGYKTFLRVRERADGIPIIVLTSLDDDQVAAQAMQDGAQDYLIKGLIEPKLLAHCVHKPQAAPGPGHTICSYSGPRRATIRMLLYSQDQNSQRLLGETLGSDIQVAVESRRDRVRELVFDGRCDVLILDIDSSPAEQHLRFFEEIRASRVPVVVMTDDNSREAALELVQRGVHQHCPKPLVLSELETAVRRAYEYARLEHDLERIKQQPTTAGCDQLIGSSERLQHVYDLIRRVAPLNAFVLITGESGTGKELIARAIHRLSERRQSPFVAVSCGAIPETLIEAELFGYEKGAFTGAVGSRKGYLEQAGQGTLFLDEIGELSGHTQVKLLRVLQERQFSRLGTSAVIPLDARILFATHRDLTKMVEEGSFRLDLYYRVNVMSIKAPALRDHAEDIPILARYFLEKYARLYQKPVSEIAASAMAALVAFEWPGNVRELENVIQKAIILTDDDIIHSENLPEDLQQPELLSLGDSLPGGSFEEQLRDYKIKLAQKAIEDCHGNKTLAARSLQISRTYLHRLIKGRPDDENADEERTDEEVPALHEAGYV